MAKEATQFTHYDEWGEAQGRGASHVESVNKVTSKKRSWAEPWRGREQLNRGNELIILSARNTYAKVHDQEEQEAGVRA